MFTLQGPGARLCDGVTRRDMLQAGGLGMLGLSLPELLRRRASAAVGQAAPGRRVRARSCILLFLMGGPPQHSTWDPKPDAPDAIRGAFKPIATAVPGMQIGELMPRLARLADRLCLLRAVATDDNAHSSSGYYMMTGHPHSPHQLRERQPRPAERLADAGGLCAAAAAGAGDACPPPCACPTASSTPTARSGPGRMPVSWGGRPTPGCCAASRPRRGTASPSSASRPMCRCRAWKGGTTCSAASMPRSMPPSGVARRARTTPRPSRRSTCCARPDRAPPSTWSANRPPLRERYGRSQFGQSVLLARRLIEAGVSLVQVNWYRGPKEPSDNPCWDSHANEAERLKSVLVPPMDQAFSALLDDLAARGMLDETLVVCLAEFGRSPKMNASGRARPLGPRLLGGPGRRRHPRRRGLRRLRPHRRPSPRMAASPRRTCRRPSSTAWATTPTPRSMTTWDARSRSAAGR